MEILTITELAGLLKMSKSQIYEMTKGACAVRSLKAKISVRFPVSEFHQQ
jgi:predicted DNA-binding transcriptional regulator AlpA